MQNTAPTYVGSGSRTVTIDPNNPSNNNPQETKSFLYKAGTARPPVPLKASRGDGVCKNHSEAFALLNGHQVSNLIVYTPEGNARKVEDLAQTMFKMFGDIIKDPMSLNELVGLIVKQYKENPENRDLAIKKLSELSTLLIGCKDDTIFDSLMDSELVQKCSQVMESIIQKSWDIIKADEYAAARLEYLNLIEARIEAGLFVSLKQAIYYYEASVLNSNFTKNRSNIQSLKLLIEKSDDLKNAAILFPWLEKIALYTNSETIDLGLENLRDLPFLKTLSFNGKLLTDVDLEAIAQLTNLTDLNISGVAPPSILDETPDQLEHLVSHPRTITNLNRWTAEKLKNAPPVPRSFPEDKLWDAQYKPCMSADDSAEKFMDRLTGADSLEDIQNPLDAAETDSEKNDLITAQQQLFLQNLMNRLIKLGSDSLPPAEIPLKAKTENQIPCESSSFEPITFQKFMNRFAIKLYEPSSSKPQKDKKADAENQNPSEETNLLEEIGKYRGQFDLVLPESESSEDIPLPIPEIEPNTASAPITGIGFRQLKQLTNLTKLNISYNHRLTDNDLEILTFMTNLKNLNLSSCTALKGTGLRHLRSKKLEKISMNDCTNLADKSLMFLDNRVNLKELSLQRCSLVTGKIFYKPTLLEIDGTLFENATFTLENLESLNLNGCNKLQEQALLILDRNPKLTNLNLGSCPTLTEKAFTHLEKVTNLKKLDLSKNSNVNEGTILSLPNLTNLRELNLYNCVSLTPLTLEILSNIPNIDVDVRECPQIEMADK